MSSPMSIKKIKWGKIAHGIPFSLCGAGAHEPMSERQSRTLKERVRCVIADQDFPVCQDLVKHAVYYAMTSLNWISGIAGQPSPREAVAGRKLDARLDCRLRCFKFVQIYVDNRHLSKSVQLARTEDALYIGPVDTGRWQVRYPSPGIIGPCVRLPKRSVPC